MSALIETTLTRLARVLTGKEDIDVIVRADGPRVEAHCIVLPDIAHADDDILTGYVDLLAARVKHGDAHALNQMNEPVARTLAQSIDDHRACMALLATYPGSRRNLARMREHVAREKARQWHEFAWRDRLLWLIDRALWNEAPTPNERNVSLLATLNACEAQIDAARRARSTAESIAASRALVAMVRALASNSANTMMFTADADETLDAETVSSQFDEFADEGDASSTDDAARAGHVLSSSSAQAEALADGGAPASFAMDEGGRPLMSEPFTTEFDIVTDLSGKGDAKAWRNLRSFAREETLPLKTRLERALRADEQTHWRREQERGELDRHALAKLAIAPGYRTPFRVKSVIEGRDTAVSILIDRSGSMAGEKIELARLCAAALADALVQLSFPCEVLGYSSVDSPEMRARHDALLASGADMRRYNRFVERLDLTVYKRFDAGDLSGLAAIECGHENPDGEALAWAAQRLAAQRAGRRILMVLSDGYPATGDGHPVVLRHDLHERVRAIAHGGIDLIGVGILNDAVEEFYPTSIVVSALHELPERAFRVLAGKLLER